MFLPAGPVSGPLLSYVIIYHTLNYVFVVALECKCVCKWGQWSECRWENSKCNDGYKKRQSKCTSNGHCEYIECKQKDNEEETEVCEAGYQCTTKTSPYGWDT